ncbi:MAG: sodium:solute symporter [Chryseolinea sp.]
MNYLDWSVLFFTIALIVTYGVIRTRGKNTMDGYLKGDNMKWWMIGISIMATQASAVTFLSVPGQGFVDGMRFLQFYFGLPLAMVIISVTIVPIYYRLKVYTAYQYLETRFDLKTRLLAAILFLLLRGLSAGITLFAPSLVLSTILGWPLSVTTVLIGSLVIIYLLSGGSKAVSLTQRYQMAIIMGGMILAGVMAFTMLPEKVTFGDSISIAGTLGKFNLVNFEFNLADRYNIWSGFIAGTFLFLSYFGTDQSQVARYLGGASEAESKLGLIFNGLLKIPMQFIILFIGVMVYIFYLFNQPPVFHNHVLEVAALKTERSAEIQALQGSYDSLYSEKRIAVDQLVDAIHAKDEVAINNNKDHINAIAVQEKIVRDSVKSEVSKALSIPKSKTEDRDYIFLNFVLSRLPHGIVGLLIAVIFSATMGSMAGELNALASTTCVDIYKRIVNREQSPDHYLRASQWFTVLWAAIAMAFTLLVSFAENLIQVVNIVGSLFYGTILGIFLTAFYIRYVKGTAVFWAALIGEAVVLYCFKYTDIAYLLYNIIGCGVVILFSLILQPLVGRKDEGPKI